MKKIEISRYTDHGLRETLFFPPAYHGYVDAITIGYSEGFWYIGSFTMTQDDFEFAKSQVGIEQVAHHIMDNGVYDACGWSAGGFDSLEEALQEMGTDEDTIYAIRHEFSGIKYIAKEIPAENRIDTWDEWSSSTYDGWFINGNDSLMPHGTGDPEWQEAVEWLTIGDVRDALHHAADWLDEHDRTRAADEVRTAAEAQVISWRFIDDLLAEKIVKVLVRFHQDFVPWDEAVTWCLSIITGRNYLHDEIGGKTPSEWNHVFFPAEEEDLLEMCEADYFNLTTQFTVSGDGVDGMFFPTYAIGDDDATKKELADGLGCDPAEIDLLMVKGKHMVYDYERR